jgi:uncharacterized protein (TIGR03437 family)
VRLKLFCTLFLTAAALQAQPSISAGGVYNVASYIPNGLPGSAIAQGSLFVVFGKNMGPTTLTVAASPLPTSLAGTSLSVTMGATRVTPFMYYTSAGQIGALMPSNTPAGTGTITVTYNGTTSASQPITVVPSSVGIFTVNQAGSGPGIITNASYVVNTLTTAAAPGDVNIIWATGVGPAGSTGNEAAGTAPLAALPSTFKVYVGGVQASIYAAARSAYPGLDQIAFTVPTGVTGCHVPVVIQSGTIISNFVTMAIGTGGVCSDPAGIGTGLTPEQLTLLQQKGSVAFGSIVLDRIATPGMTISVGGQTITIGGSTTDSGSGVFERYTFQQFTQATGGTSVSTFGACTVYTYTGQTASVTDPVVPVGLDAGSAITVTGPGGAKTLTPVTNSTGSYYASLGGASGAPLFLNAGTYTISNGTGGRDVGPFTTSITLPPALTWTNASSVSTVVRANGQLITWTGGDPAGSVEITGSNALATNNGSSIVAAAFVCVAQDSAGQFTIPAPVLLSLPQSTAGSIGTSSSFSIGSLGVGAVSAVKSFIASGLDFAYLSSFSSSSQTVTYQ